MGNTKMATATEVEGETTVSVPEEVEEALSQEPTKSENQTPSEEETPKDEGTPDEEPQAPKEESQELSPRGQKRFGKLIDKLKDRTVEVSELKRALETNADINPLADNSNQVPQARAPWETPEPFAIPEAGSEIAPEDYARHVTASADQIVNLRLGAFASQMKRVENIDRDRQELEGTYPILNPSSEDYDPEVSKKVANLFMEAQKSNPDLRLKQYVGEIMSLHQAGQVRGKEEVTPKLIKQQAEAAVTPSGSSQKSKSSVDDWETMSTAEKEEWLRENGAWD